MENKVQWFRISKTEFEENEYIEEEYPSGIMNMPFIPLASMNTIIGPMDLNSDHHILDYFNIYILETNFAISKSQIGGICRIDGVELVHPISRYKCAIGIGRLFDPGEVRVHIEHFLLGKHKAYLTISQLNIDQKEKNELIKSFNEVKKYPYWLIYVLPNGKYEVFHTSDQTDFNSRLTQYKQYQQMSNGVLLYEE